jgi:membrane peptidoglycan carboxypeptidase
VVSGAGPSGGHSSGYSDDRIGVGGRLGRVVVIAMLALLTGVLVAALALPVVGGLGVFTRNTIGNIAFTDLPPELQQPPLSQRSVILAADGTELATFYYENRQSVDLSEIAPIMRQAIVAIEDSRFYEHHGIDPKGILRARVKDSSSGSAVQGASTITQQYVRQALVETNAANDNADAARAARAKNLTRKLTEARYALALEQKLSKDEILDDYLNTVYFGSGAYGVAAAAQHYFSESPSDVTLAQAALLSGVINNPSTFDPILNPKNALTRRNIVLQRMADLKYITQAQADQAIASPLGLKVAEIPNGCASSTAPFCCEYVVDDFLSDSAFGANRDARANLLRRGGLVISTTLDMATQKAAQDAVNNVVPPDPAKNAGLAAAIDMIDPQTGAIKAMADDRTWGTGPGQTELNLAANSAHDGSSGRHAGSTFKVFVLAAALQQGIPAGTRINSPSPVTIKGGSLSDCDGNPITTSWSPHNAADSESGTFDMTHATWYSVNTYFAQLEVRTGLCQPVQTAEAMGVKLSTGLPLEQVPAFTLGAEDVDPLSVAGAFATFANQGNFCTPQAITKVTTSIEGMAQPKVPGPNCKQVLDRNVANGVTSLLQGVIDQPGGTGAGLSIGRPAAGKTGTDDDYKNAWFSGYTPNLAASVWVGNPDSATPMKNITVNGKRIPEVFGATLSGPIWQQAMKGALQKVPPQNFVQPPQEVLRGNPINVPDVTGEDVATATQTLTKLGFSVNPDMPQVPSNQPAGKVDSTDPVAGTTGYVGDPITLSVSNGVPLTPSGSPMPPSSSGPPSSPGPGSPPASPPNGGGPGPVIGPVIGPVVGPGNGNGHGKKKP